MFNVNRKLLASLTMLLTFKMAWISMFSVSCSRVVPKVQQVNLESNFIDYDCDDEGTNRKNWNNGSLLRYNNEKQYFANIILKKAKNKKIQTKLSKCVQQNFVLTDQESNEKFKKFTSFYFKRYANFEAINIMVKNATNNRVDFYNILNHLTQNQDLFKQTIVRLYNILAKLIGPQIVPYLIFDLLVVKDKLQANNALATAIAHLNAVNNQVIKSCIVFSKEAIILPHSSLLKNYTEIIWSSAHQFHPIIHEFAHSLDYFTRMSLENRVNLPVVTKTSDSKCNSGNNANNILNSNIDKTISLNLKTSPTFSTAAFDLQEYLFVNIRNHSLEDDEQSKKLLASLIVPSEYGNENNRSEFFAEAFVYWISTGENKRGRNWQILNRFFLEYFKAKYYLDLD